MVQSAMKTEHRRRRFSCRMCRSVKVLLILAVSYPTLRQIVRSQFYLNAVSWHQADVVLPHAAGDMSYDLMVILKFYPKLGAW